MKEKRYIILESFLSPDDERSIIQEVLERHRQSRPVANDLMMDLTSMKNSLKLELGIACGEDLSPILTVSTAICRRAFKDAAQYLPWAHSLKLLSERDTPLTGLSLLYGPQSSMSPHYDSPTQPGQKEEWLCMFTFGSSLLFRLDDETVKMKSGDALVMDSMSVLHGVERILAASVDDLCSKIGLPTACRLGLLFWHGRCATVDASDLNDIPVIDGLAAMYADAEEDAAAVLEL
jgi:hypothetical protein